METVKKLNGYKRIRFCDYREYESGRHNNGGCYGFWTDYENMGNGTWEVSYGTTADFNYCSVCGQFDDHYEGEESVYDSGYSCGEYKTVTDAELLQLINDFEETEDEYIEYTFLGF